MDLYGSSRDRLFEDDDEDQELGFGSDAAAANKEFLVYLIDASSDMLLPFEDETYFGTYFGAVMEAVEENLKQRILARDDKVGICFFNTIKKKNFQDTNGVYVWAEVDDLSAELIRNFRSLRETFQKDIGSQVSKGAEGGEHPLKDGLWIVQGMLRSGTSKNVGKQLLIFTNCDDPAGDCNVRDRRDFHRTTIQRAKDILEMDIGIDLIPFNRPDEKFNMKIFYTELMQLEDERAEREYLTQATSKFKDLRHFEKEVIQKESCAEDASDCDKRNRYSNKDVCYDKAFSSIIPYFCGFSEQSASKDSEIQGVEVSEPPITPPTPERSSVVIRLTRQMSRVSTGMGPMSPKFEIRASKELQELQEMVRLLEEEIKLRREECDQLTLSFKEKESQLVDKIECLEFANEQLLEGGHDSSIQLQMELTRLQRQNSVLSVRERELQFQINTQEMLNAQMLEKRPITGEVPSVSKLLESKIAALESKLAEAVEVTNMYKIQLQESESKQKGAQSDALSKGEEGEDDFMELQKLRKLSKAQETEIQDLQDRYFLVSVRLAESVAQREELLMKIKRITFKKC